MKHTPGPWKRVAGERFKHDASAGVTGPDGMYVACALDKNRYDRDEEVEANARLIAAAPDLLAALEHLLDTQRGLKLRDWQDAVNEAQTAVAKAKGETP